MRYEAAAARVISLALAAALVVAACTSSAGLHAQSPSSDSSSTEVTSPVSGSSSPSWTPPDYGDAKPAVDAYLKFTRLVDKAFRDPAHVSSSTFDKFLAGQAKLLFDSALADEKKQNKAYRSSPDVNHVRVVKNHMTGTALPWVVLRNCATPAPTNPEVEYYVNSGKPVPQKPHEPAGPYAHTIKIFLIRGQWTITSFTSDYSRTCTP